MDCSPPGSSVHGDFPGKNTGVGCHASPPRDLNSRIEPKSSALQADSLPSEPPGKCSLGSHVVLIKHYLIMLSILENVLNKLLYKL